MGMIGPQTLTIYQPVLSATGEELDGREQTWSSALGTIRVWMKQRQGGTRLSPLGATQAHAFSVRLNAPARLGTNLPQEGWRLVGQDGAEYIVRDAVWTGRLGRLTVERV